MYALLCRIADHSRIHPNCDQAQRVYTADQVLINLIPNLPRAFTRVSLRNPPLYFSRQTDYCVLFLSAVDWVRLNLPISFNRYTAFAADCAQSKPRLRFVWIQEFSKIAEK